jgi:uncharacterized protein YgiM (DUF1202 family)
MAPEVYKGERYNATVDIYSLGLVLYRLLNNNRLPFEKEITHRAAREAFERRISGEEFPDPVNGGKEIGDILRKACHIDPRQRYQTAGELKRALLKYSYCLDEDEEIDANNRQEDKVFTEETPKISESIDSTKVTLKISEPIENRKVTQSVSQREDKRKVKKKQKHRKLRISLYILDMMLAITLGSILYLKYWKNHSRGDSVSNSSELLVETATITPTLSATPETISEQDSEETVSDLYVTKFITNLYAHPYDVSEIIENIPAGEKVTVVKYGAVWCQVQYNNKEGYMITNRLKKTELTETPAIAPTLSATPETISEQDSEETVSDLYVTKFITNLYAHPYDVSEIIENIPAGEEVTVVQYGDVWSQVQYNDKEGYMITKRLEVVE